MFDPHRTRRSDRRYYTRKGQVLQAGRVNAQPVIDQRLVPVYKNYLLSNGLIPAPPPPGPSESVNVTGLRFDNVGFFFSAMQKYTTPTVNINQPSPNNDGVACLFYITLVGDSFCEFKYVAANGTYSKSIQHNKVCYFIFMDNPSTITSQETLNAVEKAIVDAYGGGNVFDFYGPSASISNAIKLNPRD